MAFLTFLVRRLAIGCYEPQQPADAPGDRTPSRAILEDWPHWANLRFFQLGWTCAEDYGDLCPFSCYTGGAEVHRLVARMPHLEELHLFASRTDGPAIARLPLGAANSPLVRIFVNEALAARPKRDETTLAGGLGRIIFERKASPGSVRFLWGVAIVCGLAAVGCLAASFAMPGLKADEQHGFLIGALVAFGIGLASGLGALSARAGVKSR